MINANPRVISYRRFSAARQSLGDSTRRQIKLSDELCKRKGWTLDQSYRLSDEGLSAFTGDNVTTGALSLFLEDVKQGKVEPGTVLIIEHLDRMSRQAIMKAMNIFTGLILAGIQVQTLIPEKLYTSENTNDLIGYLEPLMLFQQAHEASATKSKRIGESWKARRANLAKGGNLGKFCPWWIEFVPHPDDLGKKDPRGSYQLIPERAEVVRIMFQLRADGLGVPAIVKRINALGIKPKLSSKWNNSTVGKMIASRTVLGEFQPGRIVDGKEVDEGDVIKGYYPPVLDNEQDWFKAQSSGARRGRHTMRDSDLNLFKGLLYGQDGHTVMTFTNAQYYKGKKCYYRYLVSTGDLGGVPGSNRDRYKADPFERAFLQFVKELNPSDFVQGKTSTVAGEIASLSGAIAGIEATIESTLKVAAEVKVKDALLKSVAKMDEQKAELLDKLNTLKARQASNDAQVIGEIRTLGEMLEGKEGQALEDLRQRIKGKIGQLVERIYINGTVDPTRRKNNTKHYTLDVAVLFHDGTQRHFSCDHDGKLIGVNFKATVTRNEDGSVAYKLNADDKASLFPGLKTE